MKREPDEGQVMLLMVFFALIVAGLITVIVDVSTVFLAQREMQSTADGAALAAVQQANLPAVYTGQLTGQLPPAGDQVDTTVQTYATNSARVPHECARSTYAVVNGDGGSGLQADGLTVRVELSCKVPLPFVNVIAQLFTGGVTIDEVASARSDITAIAP